MITFDDISKENTSGVIPNGYKNLSWDKAESINVLSESSSSIYRKGVVSSPFVMHNPTGNKVTIEAPDGNSFWLHSLHVTSFWSDIFNFTIRRNRTRSRTAFTWFGTAGSYKFFVSCDNISCTHGDCDSCKNVLAMSFEIELGISADGLKQNDTRFVVDDLCISFEP